MGGGERVVDAASTHTVPLLAEEKREREALPVLGQAVTEQEQILLLLEGGGEASGGGGGLGQQQCLILTYTCVDRCSQLVPKDGK